MRSMSEMVSAKPVRRHLELLALRGITPAEVSRRTGYSKGTLHYIIHRAQHVHAETAEDILTVRIPHPNEVAA